MPIEFFVKVKSLDGAADACMIIADHIRDQKDGKPLPRKKKQFGREGREYTVSRSEKYLIVREL
jgi:hypothetical protein